MKLQTVRWDRKTFVKAREAAEEMGIIQKSREDAQAAAPGGQRYHVGVTVPPRGSVALSILYNEVKSR